MNDPHETHFIRTHTRLICEVEHRICPECKGLALRNVAGWCETCEGWGIIDVLPPKT